MIKKTIDDKLSKFNKWNSEDDDVKEAFSQKVDNYPYSDSYLLGAFLWFLDGYRAGKSVDR